MATAAEIQAKMDELSGNMDKLDTIVNGGENATVTTDGGVVPSVANFYEQLVIAPPTATAQQAAVDAQGHRDAAQIASEASGDTLFYDTYDDAATALGGLSEGQVVSIFADETRGGSPTRYRVESSVLVFKLDLGEFDRLMELDLRKPRKMWAKMREIAAANNGILHWVSVGDSLASRKQVQIIHQLDRMLGADNYKDSNLDGDNPFAAGGDQLFTVDAVNVTNVSGDYGIVPTGVYQSIAAGGSIRFTRGGYDPLYTKLRVYYIKEPGAGTINLLVDGVVVDTEDADQATTELGILEHSTGAVTIDPGPSTVTVTGGTVKMLGGHVLHEDKRGVAKHTLLAAGGITPVQLTQNATTRLIHRQLLQAFNPDLITLEMDDTFGDGGVNQAALDTMMDDWTTASPYADKLLIGSTPRAFNDSGKMLANLRLREVAQSRGAAFLYFDSYKVVGTRAEMVAIFGSDDGVHPNVRAQQFAAEMLWTHLGLNNQNLGFAHRPVKTPDVASSLYHGTEMRAGVTRMKFDSDNTFGYDWSIVFNRSLAFRDESNNRLFQFSHNAAVRKNIIPMGFDFGDATGRSVSFTNGDTYQNASVNFLDTNMASGYLVGRFNGIRHAGYTKATLPSFAPPWSGTILYCSDGRADGQGCFVYANSQANWRRLSDDTVVS